MASVRMRHQVAQTPAPLLSKTVAGIASTWNPQNKQRPGLGVLWCMLQLPFPEAEPILCWHNSACWPKILGVLWEPEYLPLSREAPVLPRKYHKGKPQATRGEVAASTSRLVPASVTCSSPSTSHSACIIQCSSHAWRSPPRAYPPCL